MRTPTKATLGIVSLAILAGSYQAAQANVGATSTVAAGATDPSIDTGSTGSATAVEATANTAPATDATGATTGNSQASTGSTSSGTTTGNTSSTGNTSTGSSGSVATPVPSSGNTSSGNTSTGSSGSSGSSSSATHTGSAIGYRYGTIQLEVVKTGSKITAINLIQASTKGREWAAVPSTLVSAALAANGTGFSNVGGATFTSEAFRSALESALAQF